MIISQFIYIYIGFYLQGDNLGAICWDFVILLTYEYT